MELRGEAHVVSTVIRSLIHLQSERYFGKKGLEIQETRLVNVLPKEIGSSAYQYVSPAIFQRKPAFSNLLSVWQETFPVPLAVIVLFLFGFFVFTSPFSLTFVSPFET